VWSAKEGLREDPSSFKDEGNYLEPVKVSWGGKKRRAQEVKERRRRKLEEARRKAREERTRKMRKEMVAVMGMRAVRAGIIVVMETGTMR
jgi:hypothetical protein